MNEIEYYCPLNENDVCSKIPWNWNYSISVSNHINQWPTVMIQDNYLFSKGI